MAHLTFGNTVMLNMRSRSPLIQPKLVTIFGSYVNMDGDTIYKIRFQNGVEGESVEEYLFPAAAGLEGPGLRNTNQGSAAGAPTGGARKRRKTKKSKKAKKTKKSKRIRKH